MTELTAPALFVGIDAHQESLAIAVLPREARAPEPVRVIANDPVHVRGYFRRLLRRGPIEATYEAGCFGFVLYRQLESLGVRCTVAAPSRIPLLPGDHRKTDRLDASRLALFLRGSQLTPVTPPTPQLEALRSLVRTRHAHSEDVTRARHRLQKFLLLRGHVWREGGSWSAAHAAWLRSLRLELDDDQQTFDFLLVELSQRLASLKTLDDRLRRRIEQDDVRAAVATLRAFRGVGPLVALATVAELGDPRRFRGGDQVASYIGLVPSEHSSGERIQRGAITKAGNARLRWLLVEAAQHYAKPLTPGYARDSRRAQLPAPIVELARQADQRLTARYRALAHRKHTNSAKTAVARELVIFLWRALLLRTPD